MKELYNHTPSELLNLYVDGELPTSMEPHLFNQLSQNEGLQSEMRDLLSMRDAVQNDTESFTPPVAAHRGVFDYLGYTYPGVTAPVAVQTISKFHAFVSKTWLPVLSAVIASLITTVVVNNMIDDNVIDNNVINNGNTTAEAVSKNIPVVSSFDDALFDDASLDNASIGNTSIDNASIGNNIAAEYKPNIPGLNNNSGSENNAAAIETSQSAQVFASNKISSNKISVNSFSIASIGNSSFAGSGDRASMYIPSSLGQIMPAVQSINISNGFADNFQPYEAKGYSVTARFNNARPTGAGSDLATHNAGQFSALENFSIGFIAGGGDIKFGVEIGQEAFAQSFRSKDGGILYNVEQNPLIFWGAIIARYENENFKFYDIQPFIQASLGGSELGPLGRGIIGLELITPQAFYGTKLGIQLGFESALLMYQNQNAWKSSEKNGFNLGMSLHF